MKLDFRYRYVDNKKVLVKYSGASPEVILPEDVKEIGSGAFYNCTSLQSVIILEGVTRIESEAFRGCTSLQSVVIPEGVE